jgi:catechol 2,3-dioxygenase-like lactoylglutathione lyase family enzyme
MTICKRIFLSLALVLSSSGLITAQVAERPPLWGIAKMTFLVSDFSVAREYYGRFLGFDEAFSYPSPLGEVISFKVNDRQFLEFVMDKQARDKKRLVSVSFETEDADAMRKYLISKGYNVQENIHLDGAGDEVFTIDDPSGNHIEFIEFKDDGLHRKSKGQFLSDKRISVRIHHAGLYAEKIIDNDPFYAQMLGFKEMLRYPEDKNLPAIMLYLQLPECVENIEQYSPNDRNDSHPCFLVEDMQETIYTLKERKISETLGIPGIGKGKRWILNLRNSDNTRVEFTEAHCVK